MVMRTGQVFVLNMSVATADPPAAVAKLLQAPLLDLAGKICAAVQLERQ